MASKNYNESIRGGATVWLAPVDTAVGGTWGMIGYTEGATKISFKKNEYALEVDDFEDPVYVAQTIAGMTVSGDAVQISAEMLCAALGLVQSNTITIGGSTPSATREFAVKVSGLSQISGLAVTIYIPRSYSTGEVSLSFEKKSFSKIPFEFKALGGTSGSQVLFGVGNVTKTLTTGTFARDASVNFYLVAGEGAAADSATGISGTWADGEYVVLQISSVAQPITMTHTASGTGIFNLDGATTFIMTKLEDFIKLQYSTTGTKFTEVSRYNA